MAVILDKFNDVKHIFNIKNYFLLNSSASICLYFIKSATMLKIPQRDLSCKKW